MSFLYSIGCDPKEEKRLCECEVGGPEPRGVRLYRQIERYYMDTQRLSIPVEIGNLLVCLFDLSSVQSIVGEVRPLGLTRWNKEI